MRNLYGREGNSLRPKAIIKTDIDFAIARPGPHDARTEIPAPLMSTGHNCIRDAPIPARFSLSRSPEYSLVASRRMMGRKSWFT